MIHTLFSMFKSGTNSKYFVAVFGCLFDWLSTLSGPQGPIKRGGGGSTESRDAQHQKYKCHHQICIQMYNCHKKTIICHMFSELKSYQF